MNTKQIQFNRQRVIALLVAGLILALAANLVWVRAETGGSTFLGLLSGSQSEFTAGAKLGSGTDGVSFVGSESEVLPGSLPGLMAGGRGGIFGDC